MPGEREAVLAEHPGGSGALTADEPCLSAAGEEPAIARASSKVLCHLQSVHDSFINAEHSEPGSARR